MPPGVRPYRRTPIFNESTMPAGLRREHRTQVGVWALITVLDGQLWFRTFEPPRKAILTKGETAAVAPEQVHEVDPNGSVQFYIEFFRATDRSG